MGTLSEARASFDRGDYEASYGILRDLCKAAPRDTALLSSLALAAFRCGRTKEAFAGYAQALAVDPEDAEAHFGRALLYLLHGNYPAGFHDYEWRLRRENCVAWRFVQGELWDGQPLPEGALLLHCEQGLGDALQFVRYLPQVRERVKTLYLACHPALRSLFAGLEGLAGVLTDGDPLPETTHHFPLLSLPRLLGTTLETVPARVPYLSVATMPKPPGERPRIGFVWRAALTSPNGHYKSLDLEQAADALAALPVEWVSLQKDSTPQENAVLERRFGASPAAFGSMRETAECLQTLDLLVSVDTSVVHLAGALGRPVWVLLPRWADWRWLLGRSDSPWYPTARLFRQKKERDWNGPLAEIAAALRNG